MGKKHKHKHKHHNHQNHCNNECRNGGGCGCNNHNNKQEREEHLYIKDEAEMLRLLNLIMLQGKIKEAQYEQKVIDLGNAMMADAGVTDEDLIPPADSVSVAEVADSEDASAI